MTNDNREKWFVVQTLSGHEYKVQERILKQRAFKNVEDRVLNVEVPTEKVAEVKRGKKTTTDRKFFPGYILVQMKLFDENGDIDQDVWYFIREMEGVIGFLGGQRPVPLEAKELDRILQQAEAEEVEAKPKVTFEPGETVRITDGAFANFEGQIDSVDPERGKLRLSVSIFGRSTPVEVEYWQVERA